MDRFAAPEDPRQSWKVLYPSPVILLVVLCGTLAGAEDFVEVGRWLKDNQASLHDEVRRFFNDPDATAASKPPAPTMAASRSAAAWSAIRSTGSPPTGASRARRDSPGLAAIAMIEAQLERNGNISRERRCYLSAPPLDAKLFAHAVRCRRNVENRSHWVLDLVCHEDLSRLRSAAGPQNMVTVRHFAINRLRSPTGKHSLKVGRKSAACDTACPEALLRRSPG